MIRVEQDLRELLERLVASAKEYGLENHALILPSEIKLHAEVFKMCESNACGMYNNNWTCPPASGDIDYWRAKLADYRLGLVLQSVAELEDAFDYPGMMDCELLVKNAMNALIKNYLPEAGRLQFLQVGACTLCPQCSYPNEACRQPLQAVPSVEACGILVTELCTQAGIKYYYGENTIAFTALVLLK